MSRYVDVDELHNRGWVAMRYINWEPTPRNDNFKLEVEVKPIITFSAVDVVEVCRCEHCSKSAEHLNGRWCKVHQTMTQNTDYCSWGTKK